MLELDNNLLSVGYLQKKGFPFEASNEGMRIIEQKEVRLESIRVDTLYVLNQLPNLRVIMTKKDTHDVFTWHCHLAHLNEKDIQRLAIMSTGITGLEGHVKDSYTFNKHAKSRGKIAARAWKGVHLGYGLGSNQYRIYHPEKKKVFKRRDVKFHKGRNLPVGDNGDRSEPELNADEGDTALLPNTLRREKLGHPRRHIDHTNPASEGEPCYDTYDNRYNSSEKQSGRSTTSINDDSDANDTQHPPGDTNYESPSPRRVTSGSNNSNNPNDLNDINDQPEIGPLSDEEESEEDLAIEALNENSPPPEEGPRRSGQNTQHPDYTQMHRYGGANMVIVKALAANALDKPIIYNDATTCREAPK
ncbi:MAG: hypothetical protein FRX48_04383 [Lasallia pustulata]|uniref:Retroviral polymerase SH3-like domain-containing protein n=1 Tax=Lasallia pustulata TaxID=136370 RepID=A0A5M8PRS7_9LECA|nr:MAG: hypothetical protein FRX48_04383 [Lasallia pustulata]